MAKTPMKKCACCKKKYNSSLGIQTKGGDWLCRKCWLAVRATLLAIIGAGETILKVLPVPDR